ALMKTRKTFVGYKSGPHSDKRSRRESGRNISRELLESSIDECEGTETDGSARPEGERSQLMNLPIPLHVLKLIGDTALNYRDECGGKWDGGCVEVTELVEEILDAAGIGYFLYASNPDGFWGGVTHDESHHYVILHSGWIIDATIRQYIEGPHASKEQIAAASGYPHHPEVPHVAVIPPDHQFVAQMGYESHMKGGGFSEHQPFIRVSHEEWWHYQTTVVKPWLKAAGLD
ncbi:MAG TPA: hypothetical protein V6C99_04670, partial [Oculatellaceae cyanobacterium]